MNYRVCRSRLQHEAFRRFAGDYQECPACSMGILNQVATESGLALLILVFVK